MPQLGRLRGGEAAEERGHGQLGRPAELRQPRAAVLGDPDLHRPPVAGVGDALGEPGAFQGVDEAGHVPRAHPGGRGEVLDVRAAGGEPDQDVEGTGAEATAVGAPGAQRLEAPRGRADGGRGFEHAGVFAEGERGQRAADLGGVEPAVLVPGEVGYVIHSEALH